MLPIARLVARMRKLDPAKSQQRQLRKVIQTFSRLRSYKSAQCIKILKWFWHKHVSDDEMRDSADPLLDFVRRRPK